MSKAKPLPITHPLRRASWIWPDGYMDLHNHFAHFRRDFTLEKVPERAVLHITADKSYRLWVNGLPVCRGPARGFQSRWPYDDVDLVNFLQPGANWISVEAYNPGISTFSYVHRTSARLLCAAGWDADLISDEHWKMRRSPVHRRDTARLSLQQDFQEHLETMDRGWITAPTCPEDFAAERSRSDFDLAPFGASPYDTVEPRDVPLLREEKLNPVAVTALGCGGGSPGWEDETNVVWRWWREAEQVTWQDAPPTTTVETGIRFTVEPTGTDDFTVVVLDMGRTLVGNLAVTATGANGGEVLDFAFDELPPDPGPTVREPGSECRLALGQRLLLRPGDNEHDFYHLIGFRQVALVVRGAGSPLELTIQTRFVSYPFTMTGLFDSSDDALNRIWTTCRDTQALCSLDAYVDTPWREQAQWWGDARVQARNTFFIDGDPSLLARGIRILGGQRAPDGLTYGHAPTSAHNCVLPDFSLTWILTVWDYFWQTGDLDLFEAQWERMREVLSYFEARDQQGPYGLIRYDPRFWYFGDWAPLHREGVPTLLNMWYLYTLRHVVMLLKASHRKAESLHWRQRADRLEKTIVTRLFSLSDSLFSDGLDEDGRKVRRYSVHDQTMALMLNLAPGAHKEMIRKRLLPYLRGEDLGDAARPGAFWCTHVLDEMGRRKYGPDVVEFIRRRWAPFAGSGCTWEHFPEDHQDGSHSHAWSAHPAFHLVTLLGGVRQRRVAWRSVRISPQFVPGIEHVHCRLPSPQGMIDVEWRRQTSDIALRVVAPTRIEVDTRLPLERRPDEDNLQVWQGNVIDPLQAGG